MFPIPRRVDAGHVQEMSDEQLLETNGVRACYDAGEFSVRLRLPAFFRSNP
jgi:hypothetical protein